MRASGSDVVFHHGSVFDGRRFLAAGTAVRVRGGRIVAVGSLGRLRRLGPAEPVDLAGGTLLPGFIDAHAHPVFAGHQLRRCDLRPASTEAGYLEIIARYAREHPDEEWITGGGWEMAAFPGGVPVRQPLDAVLPDRPAFLPNRDGHGAWVNTAALRLAGIDAHTPDPPDGRIERDAGGEPAGMLQEGAAALVSRLLPEVTAEDWYAGLLAAQDYLLSLGITGWQDAIVGRAPGEADPSGAYLRAVAAGTLRVNVVAVAAARRQNGPAGGRHHLAHLQVVHPEDVPRFAALGATANIQPLWATHEPQMDELTIPFLGERRAGWQYPFGSLHASAAPLCAGSDWPVSSPDPLLGVHVAANRSLPAGAGGRGPDPFLPHQALEPATALAAYTSGSARVNGLEAVTGSIRVGLDADFAIVDADLAAVKSGEIGQASVRQTWVRGQVAYESPEER